MQVTQRFAQLLTKNVGKEDAIALIMVAILCRGHVLIEDVPGVGKTTLASALARSLDCSFSAYSSPRTSPPATSPAFPSQTSRPASWSIARA